MFVTESWTHSIAEWVGIVVTLVLYNAASRRADKKDLDNRRDEAKKDIERRHQETHEQLEELKSERLYLRPHDHQESDGPLMADGIIRKRNGR